MIGSPLGRNIPNPLSKQTELYKHPQFDPIKSRKRIQQAGDDPLYSALIGFIPTLNGDYFVTGEGGDD